MIRHGDCLQVMPTLDADSMDAIVCDPPYGLRFMSKEWDHGIPGEAFWRAALRVAKPGAYLLAFGGTRTFHRLACAIEDAGWEMRDCLSWLYGSGFPKGKACLKPGWEPILLARKPAPKGAHLQIDACRLGTVTDNLRESKGDGMGFRGGEAAARTFAESAGRWPANVLLDEDAAATLDAQSGERKSGGGRRGGDALNTSWQGGPLRSAPHERDASTGGASRFYYTAKASRREREAGLEGMPQQSRREAAPRVGGGSGDWGDRVGGSSEAKTSARNVHPTVKPLALMRWLCQLVTPPGGLILDPFAGSGSTGCAAVLEGFRFTGIEREAEYVTIAERRIAHWQSTVQPELEPAA